jgi:hypothetical protein
MNLRVFVGSSIAALIATCAIASAQVTIDTPVSPITVGPHTNVNVPYGTYQNGGQYGGQYGSNVSVWTIEHHIRRVIAALEKDDRDYGGHRVRALSFLHNAHTELRAAEQFASAHGYGTPNTGYNGPRPNGAYGQRPPGSYNGQRPPNSYNGQYNNGGRRPQAQSNNNIQRVQVAVTRMIANLQRDGRDYGGHKEAALNQLHGAENELLIAERTEGYQR